MSTNAGSAWARRAGMAAPESSECGSSRGGSLPGTESPTESGQEARRRVRGEFPLLQRQVHGHSLVFFDSAASAPRPRCVLDEMFRFESEDYSNVHRGVHTLAETATAAYEAARVRVAEFLGAPSWREVIFVRGTTEGINLVASSWGDREVGPGDEILVTTMEHHSNLVPWQMLCARRGAKLRAVAVTDEGELDLESLHSQLNERTKLLAVTHISNVLGTVNPIAELSARAHEVGAKVLVDGAQAVPHIAVDVGELGCDFYAFSSHKAYGPTGIGVLWGRLSLLEAMPPWQGGGSMIENVEIDSSTFAAPPQRFEAGTPAIVQAAGLRVALDFIDRCRQEGLLRGASELVALLARELDALPGVRVLGHPRHREAAVSFVVEGVHPHDVAAFLDHQGIAVRAGHHCAQPLMRRFHIGSCSRASVGVFNDEEDTRRLLAAVQEVRSFFS